MEDEDWSKSRNNIDFHFQQPLLPKRNENGHTNTIVSVDENDSIFIEQQEELSYAQNLQPSPATATMHYNSLPTKPMSREGCAPSKCRYCGHEFEQSFESFESSVQELGRYIEKHGHMKVSREENKSLHLWIENVQNSYRNMQKGSDQCPSPIKLTPDRLEMLGHIGFEFETNVHGWYEQLNFSRQGDLNCRQDEDFEDYKEQTSETSEVTNAYQYQYEEEENEEIIDGDLIPKWLLIF